MRILAPDSQRDAVDTRSIGLKRNFRCQSGLKELALLAAQAECGSGHYDGYEDAIHMLTFPVGRFGYGLKWKTVNDLLK